MSKDAEKRTARLDMRMTEREKEILNRYAKNSRRTIASLIKEWIEILEKDDKS
jgi:predicted DNA-binding protein